MRRLKFAHHNNCPLCPIIGAEDIPGEEFYELWSMQFNIRIARKLCRGSNRIRVEPGTLELWMGWKHIDMDHVDHIPPNTGYGIMVTLPNGWGTPLIDGNHRVAGALINRHEFYVEVLDEDQTLQLLCGSMSIPAAMECWNQMLQNQPPSE